LAVDFEFRVQLASKKVDSNVIPSKDGKKLFVVGVQPRGELVRFQSQLLPNVAIVVS
jgi:hypothetical protein